METKAIHANETKQRLLDIDVGEVSLVDRPANEEEWLVVKRDDGGKEAMETKGEETKGTTEAVVEKGNGGEAHKMALEEKLTAIAKIAGEMAAGATTMTPQDLNDKLGQMQSIAWDMGGDAKVVQALSKRLEDVTKVSFPSGLDLASMAKSLQEIVTHAEKALAEVEKAKAKAAFPGAAPPFGSKEEEEESYPKAKRLVVDFDAEGGLSVESAGMPVVKGKQFTTDRKGVMMDAMTKLLNLMKEMDGEGTDDMLKKCTAAWSQKQVESQTGTPDPMAPTPEEQAAAKLQYDTMVAKSAEVAAKNAELETKLAESAKSLEDVTKRLEAVEKTRVPGNAATVDGTATVQKGDAKGMFHDVLFGG